jgi:hypothetical protein
MNNIKTKENIYYLSFSIQILFFIFLLSSMLFNRSFVGLQLYGITLGEIIVGGGLMFSLVFLILPKSLLQNFYFNSLQFYSHKLIIGSFFVLCLINNGSLFNTYSYKSSSYIWSMGFMFFGVLALLNKEQIKDKYLLPLLFVPFFNYLFSSGNYPDIFINFFREYSDKFQFLKASDIFMGYIAINFLNKFIIKSQNKRFLYFLITSSLLLPLLLFSSRGSFLGVIIYMIFEIFYSRRYIRNNKMRIAMYLLISILFFSFSVLRIDRAELSRPTVEDLVSIADPVLISDAIIDLANEKDTVNVFFSFYWHYGRLESTDPTTNWRLDIWQDILYDVINEDRLFTGYGYNEIFPAMLDPTAPGRLGRDGMNEHVHNYFVNILARGGVLQLILFLSFHLSLILYWKNKNGNYLILMFVLPSFIVSFLDITMEGVQYPLTYYFFLYYFLKNSTKVKVIELYG